MGPVVNAITAASTAGSLELDSPPAPLVLDKYINYMIKYICPLNSKYGGLNVYAYNGKRHLCQH
jgi:hypothetical protein